MTIPSFLTKYFWDVDAGALNIHKDQRFIIERILEKGDDEAITWLRQVYTDEDISDVLVQSRRLSLKSRHYWELVFNLWSTANQSTKTQSAIWKY